MRTASIKHPVPDQVNPSFVIFDIRADAQRWASECLSVRVPRCQKLHMMALPGLAQDASYLYHMTTVGI